MIFKIRICSEIWLPNCVKRRLLKLPLGVPLENVPFKSLPKRASLLDLQWNLLNQLKLIWFKSKLLMDCQCIVVNTGKDSHKTDNYLSHDAPSSSSSLSLSPSLSLSGFAMCTPHPITRKFSSSCLYLSICLSSPLLIAILLFKKTPSKVLSFGWFNSAEFATSSLSIIKT